MTPDQLETYVEIRKLLREAYEHYFADDGGYKSSEGYVEIGYPNIFEEMEAAPDGFLAPPVCVAQTIGIYSYALGPSRMHYFSSFDEALETVREWHRAFRRKDGWRFGEGESE